VTQMLTCFALFLVVDDQTLEVARACQLTSPGYVADVEVIWKGVTLHGRLIVNRDGCVHLENLDREAQRWASAVICRATSPSRGWDDRIDPVRCVWRRLGQNYVLAEIHTTDASIKVSRHQPLSAR